MPYSAQISRKNPTCVLILIDQSGSMVNLFGRGEQPPPKALYLAQSVNRLLQELVIKCAADTQIRRYFQVGVIGYGLTLGPALPNSLAGSPLVWIDDLASNPLRVDDVRKRVPDGAGGLAETTIKFPVWFDPIASGPTPMRMAFATAHSVLSQWVQQHPQAFPPVLINFTDGESTDGDARPEAAAIKALATDDGSVLVLNAHLSSDKSQPFQFPDDDERLPDQFAKMLYDMSSVMPAFMREAAQAYGYAVRPNSRGYLFNADAIDVTYFLNIGTSATSQLR